MAIVCESSPLVSHFEGEAALVEAAETIDLPAKEGTPPLTRPSTLLNELDFTHNLTSDTLHEESPSRVEELLDDCKVMPIQDQQTNLPDIKIFPTQVNFLGVIPPDYTLKSLHTKML